MLCAAAGLDATLSNSAPDSPTARQLVKKSDGQLTLSPVKNIGDVFSVHSGGNSECRIPNLASDSCTARQLIKDCEIVMAN